MDLDIDPWIQRIRDQVPQLRGVAGAAELAAVKDLAQRAPHAWVIPLAEDAGQNVLLNAVSQRVTERIGVVIAVRNSRDARGHTAHNVLRYIRRQIKDALIGWLPDPNEEEVTFNRGRLIDFSDRVIWWQDEYVWSYEERGV